jgi:hypothetical protein
MTQVWVAARTHDYRGPSKASAWEVLGIYSSEAAAAARCRVAGTDFVGPLSLDVDLPEELIEWPGAYHPLLYPSAAAQATARAQSPDMGGAP